jgi:antirestriction protein ArdC
MTKGTVSSSQDKVTAVHNQLLEQMEKLVTSEDWTAFLELAARFHSYSSNNCMLIFAQRPDATRVASYTTWQSLGRNVRKGEKGISILAPCRYRVDEKNTSKSADKPDWKVRGFKVAHVFDVSQTEGDALPDGDIAVLLEGSAPMGMWESIRKLIEGDGYSVSRGDCGTANGYTNRTTKQVVIAPQLSDAAAAKTLVHELAHVRQTSDHYSIASRSLCEIEAESVAYVVCNSFGISSAPYSIGYVAGWAGGDLDVVKRTAAWVVKQAHRIIEESEAILQDLTSAA